MSTVREIKHCSRTYCNLNCFGKILRDIIRQKDNNSSKFQLYENSWCYLSRFSVQCEFPRRWKQIQIFILSHNSNCTDIYSSHLFYCFFLFTRREYLIHLIVPCVSVTSPTHIAFISASYILLIFPSPSVLFINPNVYVNIA